MKCDVEYFISTCVKYQKFKFHTLQVDLIGSWNVEVKQVNSKSVNIKLKALTIIDVGRFCLKIVPYYDKKAVSIAKLFDQEWLY